MIYLFTHKYINEYRHFVFNDNMIYRTWFSQSMDLPKNQSLYIYLSYDNGEMTYPVDKLSSEDIISTDFFMNNCDLRIITTDTTNISAILYKIIDEIIFNI